MSVRQADSMPAQEVTAGTATKVQVLIGPDQGPNFAMRRFVMEPGGGMPLHTNKVEHEQYVLSGSARVQIGDDVHHVKAGDVVYIPGGVPHNYDAGDDGFEFLCVVPNQPDEIELVNC
jgi:quercetin dioxygenase-like cupin family protein